MTACIINDYFRSFLTLIGYDLPGFKSGMVITLVGLLVFIIFLKIVFSFFRKKEKKCSGFTADLEHGKLYITKIAVADMVKSKEAEVAGVHIVKTYLVKNGKSYAVKIETELVNDNGIDPERVSQLQNKVLSAISDKLGIKSVEKVDIIVNRVKQGQ